MNARKKLDKLCKEQLCNEVKTYDEALDFLREFTCVYDKCKSDKEYVPGLSLFESCNIGKNYDERLSAVQV